MITMRLLKKSADQIIKGCPWIMRHEAVESSEWLASAPGSLARIETERGETIGIGIVNPLSQIVCRVLSLNNSSGNKNPLNKTILNEASINTEFFATRITQALKKRESFNYGNYYRLIHAEADALPGLIVDRFDKVLVIQIASAGMEKLQHLWLAALDKIINPETIILRNDFPARKLEGLAQQIVCIKGKAPEIIELRENDCLYLADIINGQKTGWFYDMRDNRKMLADRADGKRFLDVFAHSGGFGILAAKYGAKQVTMVDSSAHSLSLAAQAAEKNHLTQCTTIKGDAFAVMNEMFEQNKKFDIVVVDPPAYVKNKKDLAAALKAYAKLAAQSSSLVADGGLLFAASCSHHAGRSAFNKAIISGTEKSGKKAQIIKQSGAAKDHPLHQQLPQSEYLKGLLLQIN